ncbi:MAG: 50S ribosomal protein L13 [Candidatus Vogelbacteria bacterium]|nr:50S ribosomal protein L13 [Candidatus Vogelbacteria bacterium]
MKTEMVKIDAENKTIGRVASDAATFLMGKNLSSFTRNMEPKTRVLIVNASKANIPHKKLDGKLYFRFTGYPGGRKSETLGMMIKKGGGYKEVFTKAVFGMLPSNKLRAIMMKNLNITE